MSSNPNRSGATCVDRRILIAAIDQYLSLAWTIQEAASLLSLRIEPWSYDNSVRAAAALSQFHARQAEVLDRLQEMAIQEAACKLECLRISQQLVDVGACNTLSEWRGYIANLSQTLACGLRMRVDGGFDSWTVEFAARCSPLRDIADQLRGMLDPEQESPGALASGSLQGTGEADFGIGIGGALSGMVGPLFRTTWGQIFGCTSQTTIYKYLKKLGAVQSRAGRNAGWSILRSKLKPDEQIKADSEVAKQRARM